MSGYDRLRATCAGQAASGGISEAHAAMLAILLEVLTLARYVPPVLRPGMLDACTRWYLGVNDVRPLEPARVECWHFLEAKNGDSSTVIDLVDLAVRGLICVLYNEEPTLDDVDMTLDFFGGMSDRIRVDGASPR